MKVVAQGVRGKANEAHFEGFGSEKLKMKVVGQGAGAEAKQTRFILKPSGPKRSK